MTNKQKVKLSIFMLLLGFFYFSSAYSQQVENDVTVDIDVMEDFPFDYAEPTYPKYTNFLKSPLEENFIWLGSGILNMKLDLETGEISKIEKIFGYDTKGGGGIRGQFSKQDPYDYNIFWIYINNVGMIKYSRDTKSHILFKINRVESIDITSDNIILGSINGLIYIIEKTTGSVKILYSKLNDNIHGIAYENPGKYVLNRQYYFYPEGDSLIIIPYSERNKYLQERLKSPRHWLYPFGQYKRVYQGDEVWFYKLNQLYRYDTVSGLLSKINYKPQIDIKKIKTDDSYLYLLGMYRFMIINKNYLLSTAEVLDLENTKQKRLFKQEVNNQYSYWNAGYNELINKLDYLNSTYSNSTDIYIVENLEQINYRLILVSQYDELREAAISKIGVDAIKPEYLEPILNGLVKYYYSKAIVDSALYYHSIFDLKFPGSKLYDEAYIRSVQKLKEVNIDMLKLDSLNLSGDHYLWEKAEICRKLVGSDWNCGEGGCNTEIYFQFYRILLEKYPDSEYADDVKFIMIKSNEGSSHEGGNQSSNLLFIEEYKEFLEKYPSSEYVPDVLYQLAGLYAYADVSWEKLYKFNKKALNLYLQIQIEYPDYQNRYLEYSINQVNRALPILSFELSIKSNKEVYDAGEPINITILLENNFDKPQDFEFRGLDSIPMAFLKIERISDDRPKLATFNFVESYYHNDLTTLSIAPSEQYSETWDITKKAFRWRSYSPDYNLGYFILTKGSYKITAYNTLTASEFYYLHSESIVIEVN